MNSKVDVSIAFYGKPYQAIVTIKTLLQNSGQHIDTIYLSREQKQPHEDYIGIFRILDYFRNTPQVKIVVQYPHHHLGLGIIDLQKAKTDRRWRHSIMYQYALETTDKKYLCIMHNDMLYYGDIIGDMLKEFDKGPESLAGVGSIGQCWSCPAGPNWGNKCNSNVFDQYRPSLEEAIELTNTYNTPRQSLQREIINKGRIHIMPECRLNEYCAIIDTEKYRKETVPNGEIGCYGGNWGGVDTATIWSHDMYKKGYTFQNIYLEKYAKHAPFDDTGSGTKANTSSDLYFTAERKAKHYLESHFGPIQFSIHGYGAFLRDKIKRETWLAAIHTYGFAKKMVGKE